MRTKRIYILLLLTGLASCQAAMLTEEELQQYSLDPENGLLQRIEKQNTVLEMYYKPTDLIVAQELKGVTDVNERKKTAARLDSLDYFVLRLSREGKEIETGYARNEEAFNKVIDYLSFNMAPDVFMVCQKDTLTALDVVYARTFGSKDATSVMAVFNSNLKNNKADAKVFFDDPLFGTGLNQFEFRNKDIQKIPNLKFE